MKRVAFALCLLALLVCSCGKKNTQGERLLSGYALATIPTPDLSNISDNGKEVLNLYRFAADQADSIYWKQVYGDKSALLSSISDPALREYALVNYGPWDRITGETFVDGASERKLGACFYPADISAEEFQAFNDPAKESPYTLIVRDEDGKLKAVPYHEAYSEEVSKIASYLRAAANITIKPSVAKYLNAKADALLSDDYFDSDKAWLDMTDSKMDLAIGPSETIDDELLGLKASYGAYVLLKNEPRTEELSRLSSRMDEFQAMLPGNPAYRNFTPGSESEIFSCNVLYCTGYFNAGYKVIGINLPYDATVQEKLGSRSILFDNIIRYKYNYTVYPTANVLLYEEDAARVDEEAFYWDIVFREIAKGLGVKETVNGKGSVADALGVNALTLEKAKSNVLGTLLCVKECDRHEINAIIESKGVLASFIANVLRSCRFGDVDATGKANFLIYNSLVEGGAIARTPAGKYGIDYDKTLNVLNALGAEILEIQATGDAERAAQLLAQRGGISEDNKADKLLLEVEKVPVDIRFAYE